VHFKLLRKGKQNEKKAKRRARQHAKKAAVANNWNTNFSNVNGANVSNVDGEVHSFLPSSVSEGCPIFF
jgi:hypothetical protein